MAAANVMELTDTNFQSEVLDNQSAGARRFLGSVVRAVPQDLSYDRRIGCRIRRLGQVGKVNIDDNQQSAFKYGIEAIPTLLVFKGGQPVQRFQGIPTKSKIQECWTPPRHNRQIRQTRKV